MNHLKFIIILAILVVNNGPMWSLQAAVVPPQSKPQPQPQKMDFSNYIDVNEAVNDLQQSKSAAVASMATTLDLEELNPKENNCRFINVDALNRTRLTCSKIPLFCRSVCEQAGRLSFDQNLKRIASFSFASYVVNEPLELFFGNNLRRIDSDAFNGMVVEEDVVLKVNIGFADVSKSDYNNQLDDLNNNVEEDGDDVDNDDTDQQQIEYDIQTPSTKPDLLISELKMSLKILFVASNAFRGITLKEGARVIVTVKKFDKIEFGAQSMIGMKQLSSSAFSFVIGNSGLVLFRSNCANSWKAYTDEYIADYDSEKQNLDYSSDDLQIENTLFRVSLKGVNKVLFERDSFSNMRLFNSSTFQIKVDNFDQVMLGKMSFSNIVQQKSSNFELNLSQGKNLKLSEALFSDLTQNERAKFVVYFGLDNSRIENMLPVDESKKNLCVRESTFANLSQAPNSTVRLTFLGTKTTRLTLGSRSFANLTQALGSVLQVYVLRLDAFSLQTEAFTNVTQAKESSIEIWASQLRGDFVLAARTFSGFTQAERSNMRLGFVSSEEKASYVQSSLAFEKWNSTPSSSLVYDFTQGTQFNLKFPQRPIPRMNFANGLDSLEVSAMRYFPNLGRSSRPDTLNLNDYELGASEFCRIVDVPFDVLVTLTPKTQCSCPVYYLYRVWRRLYNDTEWRRKSTPLCYQSASDDELAQAENECAFRDKTQACREKELNDAVLNGDTNSKDNKMVVGKCEASGEGSFEFYSEHTLSSSSTSSPVYDADAVEDNSDDDNEDDDMGGDDLGTLSDVYDLEAGKVDKPQKVSEDDKKDLSQIKPVSIDSGSLTADNFVPTIAGDEDEDEDDEDDEEDEEDDDDEVDNPKGEIIKTNPTGPVASPPSTPLTDSLDSLFFTDSSMVGFAITAITSLILVLIALFVIAIIARMRCCSTTTKDKFSTYYEDDNDDGNDDEDDDLPSDDEEFLEQKKKKYGYSVFENSITSQEAAPDYSLVVKCEEKKNGKRSIVGLSLRDDVISQSNSTTGLINVQSNPLGNL